MNYFKYPLNPTEQNKKNFMSFEELDLKSISGYPKHIHNYYEFILFLDGKASYGTNSFYIKLKPYDLIVTPSLSFHYIKLFKNCAYKRVLIKVKDLELGEFLKTYHSEGGVYNISKIQPLRSLFDIIQQYSTIIDDNYDKFQQLIDGTVKAICSLVVSLSPESNIANSMLEKNTMISRISTYIEKNLKTVTIDSIAKDLNISKSYIWYLFKKNLNISAQTYIINKRLIMAKSLIEKGWKKADAAEECGYENYPSFYRAYTKLYRK